ncbi:Protein of unknown function DUF668 [Cinnamomum micranthum f. kanehirae]|uniref:DUF3475 domain-containing protein n=1 Tax=Cinnamomum micranthum f. kanehirae TaxID=337451 RepID=A0A3S3MEZ9_9MAGN|nr:Protein of unknown function DUF668 [Cinnamomum micranthum f. kanehirae]
MVSESWFSRVWRTKKSSSEEKAAIGVLAFEVASLMSRVVGLWQSLGDDQITRLRDEILNLEGVRKLVSDDDDDLLRLALAEILDNLGFLARSVARLGKRCSDSVLRGLDAVFEDLAKNAYASADAYRWEFSWRKMGKKVKKMERFISTCASLYQEMEELAELEQGFRRMQVSISCSSESDQSRVNLLEMQQRVLWQRQAVKRIRESSLWNRSYDYVVRLLARSLITIFERIKLVFGIDQPAANVGAAVDGDSKVLNHLPRSQSISALLQSSVHPSESNNLARFASGPLGRPSAANKSDFHYTNSAKSGPIHRNSVKSGPIYSTSGQLWSRTKRLGNGSGAFRGCITGGGGEQADVESSSFDARCCRFGPPFCKSYYCNEKFVTCPHLIAPDARDDLYNMLPTSIRAALRIRLKSYSKNLTSDGYDAGLAAEWTAALGRILDWLAPLAHNMIRWQSERTFEQQHLVSKTKCASASDTLLCKSGKDRSSNYGASCGSELHM